MSCTSRASSRGRDRRLATSAKDSTRRSQFAPLGSARSLGLSAEFVVGELGHAGPIALMASTRSWYLASFARVAPSTPSAAFLSCRGRRCTRGKRHDRSAWPHRRAYRGAAVPRTARRAAMAAAAAARPCFKTIPSALLGTLSTWFCVRVLAGRLLTHDSARRGRRGRSS